MDQHPEMAAKVDPTNGEMLLHLICCHPKVWSLLVDMVLVLLSAKKSAASGPFEPPPSSSDVKPKRATRSLAVAVVAAGDEAATKGAVDFGNTGGDALTLARLEFCPVARSRDRGRRLDTMTAGLFGNALDKRIPFPAAGTLPLPFRTRRPALGATVD